MTDDACFMALGLNRGAPSEEIRKAYRNLSLKLHPDASGTQSTAAGFGRVVRAYKTLTVAGKSLKETKKRPDLVVMPDRSKNDVFELGQLLCGHPDAATRIEAAKYLGLSGKRSVWVFLRRGLSDPDERVVCSCVRAAAVLGLAQGGAEIASAWQRGSPACRKTILRIAEATRSALLLPVLQAAGQAEQPELRSYSRSILREYQKDGQ